MPTWFRRMGTRTAGPCPGGCRTRIPPRSTKMGTDPAVGIITDSLMRPLRVRRRLVRNDARLELGLVDRGLGGRRRRALGLGLRRVDRVGGTKRKAREGRVGSGGMGKFGLVSVEYEIVTELSILIFVLFRVTAVLKRKTHSTRILVEVRTHSPRPTRTTPLTCNKLPPTTPTLTPARRPELGVNNETRPA